MKNLVESILQSALRPIQPRGSYILSLKDRLLHPKKMLVEVEPVDPGQQNVTLAAVGLGVIASIAAIAAIATQLAGKAVKTRSGRSEATLDGNVKP